MTRLVVDAVLFDMDGTLVDSTAAVEQMWTEFAHEVGADPNEVIAFAHGRPSTATITRFAPAQVAAAWTARIHAGEAERFNEVSAIPGAAQFVNAIPAGRWAIVTSALHGPARERVALVGISPPAVVIGADDVANGKPNPEGYLAAASALGVDPLRCVVFEDTEAGIEAGLAAGCAVVAVGEARAQGIAARIADFSGAAVVAGAQLVLTFP